MEVGEGAYGKVYRVQRWVGGAGDGRVVAIKTDRHAANELGVPHNMVREIGMLRELRHEHIVRLLEVKVSAAERLLQLVLEWAEYDLQDIIALHRAKETEAVSMTEKLRYIIPLALTKGIMYQLLDATDYLHSNWIMHRDIKPANILLTEDGVVKLADFGMARVFHAPPRPLVDDKTVVTLHYRAPELLLKSRHYTPAVDVWSLGAVFGGLLYSGTLFAGRTDTDQLGEICKRLGTPDCALWPTLEDMPEWENAASWHGMSTITLRADAERQVESDMMSRYQQKARMAEIKQALKCFWGMLEYDPAARLSCKELKELQFFVGASRSNVLAEYGPDWKWFYEQKSKSQKFAR